MAVWLEAGRLALLGLAAMAAAAAIGLAGLGEPLPAVPALLVQCAAAAVGDPPEQAQFPEWVPAKIEWHTSSNLFLCLQHADVVLLKSLTLNKDNCPSTIIGWPVPDLGHHNALRASVQAPVKARQLVHVYLAPPLAAGRLILRTLIGALVGS